MKTNEYIPRYGESIDFPKNALDMIGKTQIIKTENKQTKALAEDVRFSEITFVREDGNVLAIEFLFNNFNDAPFWCPPVPTEIKEPKTCDDYLEFMKQEAVKTVKHKQQFFMLRKTQYKLLVKQTHRQILMGFCIKYFIIYS